MDIHENNIVYMIQQLFNRIYSNGIWEIKYILEGPYLGEIDMFYFLKGMEYKGSFS